MDASPFYFLAFSSILSLVSTSCTRCGFKTYEMTIPRRRIDYHVCGDHIASAVSHLCANPRPKTKRPKPIKATLKPTTPTIIKTTQQNKLSTVSTTSSRNTVITTMPSTKGPTTYSQVGNHSQANFNETQSGNASRIVNGNGTVLTNDSAGTSARHQATTGVTSPSLDSPPLLTTLDTGEYGT